MRHSKYSLISEISDRFCFCENYQFKTDQDFNLENIIKNVMLTGHRSIIDTFLTGPLNSPKNMITGYNADCGAGQLGCMAADTKENGLFETMKFIHFTLCMNKECKMNLLSHSATISNLQVWKIQSNS